MARDAVLVGRIVAVYGVRGEVRVHSYMASPESIAAYGALVDDAGRSIAIGSLRRLKSDAFAARIAGVGTREEAQSYVGAKLYLLRARLPEPPEDEFYYADLIGLHAFSTTGASLGTIADIWEYGAGPILQIVLDDGGELLVPFTKKNTPLIDLAAGRVVIDPPAEASDPTDPPARTTPDG